MGATYKGLYLPSVSETGWEALVNANWTRIADRLAGTRSIVLTAAQGTSNTGAKAANVGIAFPGAIDGFPINNAATSGAYWTFMTPADIDDTIEPVVRPIWAPTAADGTAHSIRWSLNISHLVHDTAAQAYNGAGVTIAWTGDSATRVSVVPVKETGQAFTGFSPPANDWCRLNVSRVGADALDTLTVDARLFGVQIDYTLA